MRDPLIGGPGPASTSKAAGARRPCATEIQASRAVAPDFRAPSKPISTKLTKGAVEAACLASFDIAQCAFACFWLFFVSDRLASQMRAPGAVHTTRRFGVGRRPDVKY